MARADGRARHPAHHYSSRAQSNSAANQGARYRVAGTGMRGAGNGVSDYGILGSQAAGDGTLVLEGEGRSFPGYRRSRYGAAASNTFRGAKIRRETIQQGA